MRSPSRMNEPDRGYRSDRRINMQKAITALSSVALVALVTIGAANSVQAQDKINLVLGSADHPLWTSAIVAEEHMPKLLDEYSEGRITTERFFGGKLCSEHNCVEQMGQGTVDIAKISLYNVGAFGQTFDFINLPLLWKDADAVKDIFDRWLWDEVRSPGRGGTGISFPEPRFPVRLSPTPEQRPSGENARGHHGHQDPGHQEPDRLRTAQELGRCTRSLRLVTTLHGGSRPISSTASTFRIAISSSTSTMK